MAVLGTKRTNVFVFVLLKSCCYCRSVYTVRKKTSVGDRKEESVLKFALMQQRVVVVLMNEFVNNNSNTTQRKKSAVGTT